VEHYRPHGRSREEGSIRLPGRHRGPVLAGVIVCDWQLMGTRPPAGEIEQPVIRPLLLPVSSAGGLRLFHYLGWRNGSHHDFPLRLPELHQADEPAYGDITLFGRPARALTWLEVMFGQFFMAGVVAQPVGTKLAHALREGGSEAK